MLQLIESSFYFVWFWNCVGQISSPWLPIYRQKTVIDSTCTRKSRSLYSDLLSPPRPYSPKLLNFASFSSSNVSFYVGSTPLPCPSLPFLALPCPSLPFPCLSSLAIFFNDWHCTSDLISNQRGEGGIQHAHLFAEAGANPGYAHPRHVRRSNDGTSWGKNPTNRLKRTQIKKRRKKRESRKEGQRKRDRI